MQEFFRQFEDYCKTPGVDSGKARSYAKAIEYLCDYLEITAIDIQSVALIKELVYFIYIFKYRKMFLHIILLLTWRLMCLGSEIELISSSIV